MTFTNITKGWLFTIALSTISLVACSQPASPAATAEGKIGAASVSIKYSSPAVKGRQILGALYPMDRYGEPVRIPLPLLRLIRTYWWRAKACPQANTVSIPSGRKRVDHHL